MAQLTPYSGLRSSLDRKSRECRSPSSKHDPLRNNFSNGRQSTRRSTNPEVLVSELRNVENDAGFYVVRHDYSPSGTRETFQIDVDTSVGTREFVDLMMHVLLLTLPVRIPQHGGQITLNGHQSKILVTDFKYGSKSLLYSTAEVLTFAVLGANEVLALWLPEGETGEFTVNDVSSIEQTGENELSKFEVIEGDDRTTVSYTQEKGLFTTTLDDGSTVLLLDREAAYLFWAPTLTNEPHAPVNETGESFSLGQSSV